MPADLRPELDPTHLAVTRWPTCLRPPSVPKGFSALVVNADEVTLVCGEEQTGQYDAQTREQLEVGWRVTVAGPLPWEQAVRAAQADLSVSVLGGDEPPEPRPGPTNR